MTPPAHDTTPVTAELAHRAELDPVEYLTDAVVRLERAVTRINNKRLRPWNMTLTGYIALTVLARRDNLSMSQVARRCFVRPQTMIRIIAELETRGWVSRENGRSTRLALTLTDKGRRALQEMDVAVSGIKAILSEGLTNEDISQLNTTLRNVSARVETAEKEE